MKEHLGRCAEHLRNAVRHLAHSSCATPHQKLRNMYEDARFGSICEDDFLEGSLKDDFLNVRGSLIKASETQAVVNISEMSDEQARTLTPWPSEKLGKHFTERRTIWKKHSASSTGETRANSALSCWRLAMAMKHSRTCPAKTNAASMKMRGRPSPGSYH